MSLKRILVIYIVLWSFLFHLFLIIALLSFSFKNKIFSIPEKNKLNLEKVNPVIFFDDTKPIPKIVPPKINDIKKEDIKKLEALKKLEELKKEQDKKQDNGIPATLKARKSVFGIPDKDEDWPEFTPPPGKIKKDGNSVNLKETKPENLEPILEKKEIKQEKVKSIQETKSIEKSPSEKINSKITENIIEKTVSGEEKEKLLQEIKRKQELIQNAQSGEVNLPEFRNYSDGIKNVAPVHAGKKSIIALTKGFVENLKGTGSDWIDRKGDDNKRPSTEELKYISYEMSITWHLQHSWKQNFEQTANAKRGGILAVSFTINKDGKINEILLVESSGDAYLDKIVLKSIELASPLPPVPDHFNVDTYRTGRQITVSSYNLRI